MGKEAARLMEKLRDAQDNGEGRSLETKLLLLGRKQYSQDLPISKRALVGE